MRTRPWNRSSTVYVAPESMPTRVPSALTSSSVATTFMVAGTTGITTSEVRVLIVLAGSSHACGFLAARTWPVSRSAMT
jgi:hypothetical protein